MLGVNWMDRILVPYSISQGFLMRLFSSHAYFRVMIIQNIHQFLGTLFQNTSYILADFNEFKYFYVSIIPVMLWYLHLYLRSMLSMFQLQFLVQRKSNMLIFETIFKKVTQFWFMLFDAYFWAILIFKQALIIVRGWYLVIFNFFKILPWTLLTNSEPFR